jgi:uncharacterized protein (TIGR03086 family)
VVVHGWDVAASTGQDTELEPDLVEACFEVLEPQLDLLVATGEFGTRVDVPESAGRQSQLLGLLGRHG